MMGEKNESGESESKGIDRYSIFCLLLVNLITSIKSDHTVKEQSCLIASEGWQDLHRIAVVWCPQLWRSRNSFYPAAMTVPTCLSPGATSKLSTGNDRPASIFGNSPASSLWCLDVVHDSRPRGLSLNTALAAHVNFRLRPPYKPTSRVISL